MYDPGYGIEQIHDMLEVVENALQAPGRGPDRFDQRVDMISLDGEAWLLLNELRDDGVLEKIGINASLGRRLIKKDVSAATAKATFNRIRTFLRSLDSRSSTTLTKTHPEVLENSEPVTSQSPAITEVIVAERWLVVRRSAEIAKLVASISALLAELLVIVAHSNVPPGDAVVSEIQRAQLIAVLETALAMLKGPMVETGFLKSLTNRAKNVAMKAAEKQTERAMGAGMDILAQFIGSLLRNLF